jgi:hypothetical protein
MQTIVPLADSGVHGPLGLAHLPRLWLKRLLHASGRLAPGYVTGDRGWDRDLLDLIALDATATFAYLDTLPAYPAFEAWVRAHAGRIDAAAVAAANAATLAAELRPDLAASSRAFVGLDDPGQANMVLLNALEDWQLVHQAAVAGTLDPIVPAISSQSMGPLGLRHLPRFWLKALLAATGSLYEGWKSGAASGFDTWFAKTAGIDLQTAVDYVTANRPTYLDYERWFAANAANATPGAVAAQSAASIERLKPPEVAEADRATVGMTDPSFRLSYALNDLVDWHTIHGILTGDRA